MRAQREVLTCDAAGCGCSLVSQPTALDWAIDINLSELLAGRNLDLCPRHVELVTAALQRFFPEAMTIKGLPTPEPDRAGEQLRAEWAGIAESIALLLRNPQPGLSTWLQLFVMRREAAVEFFERAHAALYPTEPGVPWEATED